jgi:hypothetical protein
MPLIRVFILSVTYWFASSCLATERCPVSVQLISEPASASDIGIVIKGAECTSNLEAFWSIVERKLPNPIPKELKWISVIGPMGPDHMEALSNAWKLTCSVKSSQATAFLQSYRTQTSSRILAPSLAKFKLSPSDIDNFYPISHSSGTSIKSSNCSRVLLPPVIYYSSKGI